MTTQGQVGNVLSVNVGGRKTVVWAGRQVETGIWKSPVAGRLAVVGVNLEGDDQADRRVHGGPDKALYAYSSQDYAWWSERLGRQLQPGTFGENLTVAGIDLSEAVVGQRWFVGTTVLEVSQPRLPCFKLGIRMGDPTFPDLFEAEGRFGVYLRINQEGEVGAGDEIEAADPPEHGLTAYAIANSYPHPPPDMAEKISSIMAVPEGWRVWAERAVRQSAG